MSVVVLAEVRHGVEVRRGEVADVEVDLEVLRHLQRASAKLSGDANSPGSETFEWPCIATDHLVFLGERRDALRDLYRRRRGDDLRAEGLGLSKPRSISSSREARIGTVVPARRSRCRRRRTSS